MRDVKQITFLLDRFAAPSPGQQLLDRFLLGFPDNGDHRPIQARLVAWLPNPPDEHALGERTRNYGLTIVAELAEAVRNADAVVISGWGHESESLDAAANAALRSVREGTPVFVEGLLGPSRRAANQRASAATDRKCPLLAGTALPFAFRLPDVDLPKGARVREALIVVQGPFPAAELDGLEGLLPLLEHRHGGETGIKRVRRYDDNAVWQAGEKGLWSWPLLAAALSRSDTPQGNALLDGRNEDLVGLGLVQTLAKNPRAWVLEHRDGLRSAILVLDGVVADINFAIGLRAGGGVSAQLFRPPAPQQEHFSRLAAALLDYFTSGIQPWPLNRSLVEAEALELMRNV